MKIRKLLRKLESEYDIKAEHFVWKYPVLGTLSIFIGMPVLILLCVCVSTTVIAFPMAWLFGWL